jgi:hypothetical protein
MIPFLSLADLAQFVRCGRRCNGVARKERSRQLHLQRDARLVPLPSSSLIHHVTSLRLQTPHMIPAYVTRDTLRQLKECPRLASLHLQLDRFGDSGALMQKQTKAQTAAALRAVLPTQLTSFGVAFGGFKTLCAAFCAAISVMPQLTELSIFHTTIFPLLELPPGMLTHFPRLRKLKLHRVDWTAQALAELKQLSELRELSFHSSFMQNVELVAVCAPPHSLQLESIKLERMSIDEMAMRALLYHPTLTALEATEIKADAWPRLPQLPLLCRLSFNPEGTLTTELTASLAAALSGGQALVDLSLPHVGFEEALTEEQRSACWAQILRSVPNLRRLHVAQFDLPSWSSCFRRMHRCWSICRSVCGVERQCTGSHSPRAVGASVCAGHPIGVTGESIFGATSTGAAATIGAQCAHAQPRTCQHH